MKIEFTRDEVELIIVDYANRLIQCADFDSITTDSYKGLPDIITVEKENEA